MAGTTDTVKAMLTPGEFVIRKEAVDMIGVPILEKLNDMPEAGGHSEIDRLIAMATLKNMTGMYGGGNVEAYGHGGKVHGGLKPIPNNNPGLAKLPEAVRNKMGYMQEGGSVSDATATNLMNMLYEQSLPTQNNYGSLQDQDRIDMINQAILDSAMGAGSIKNIKNSIKNIIKSPLTKSSVPNLKELFKLFKEDLSSKQYGGLMEMMKGGEAKKKKKMYGYQDGGQAFAEPEIRRNNPNLGVDPYMRYAILEGMPMMDDPLYYKSDALADRLIQGGSEMSDVIPYKERRDFKKYVESGEGNARDEMLLRKLIRAIPVPSRIKGKGQADLANMNFLAKKGYDRMREDILQKEGQPMRDLRKAQEDREDILYNILDTSSFFNKQNGGAVGYQEGGAVQEDAMMQQYLQSMEAQQPNSFVPFDQRPPSSGEVMSPIPRGMEQGDYYRSLRNELEMENKELVRDKAQNTLDRIRLDSLLNQVEESKMDSLLNQAPPINEMLRSLPDFPTIENPPRPTKTDFLKELLREGVII
jgi:hypothetical protein